MAEHDEIPQIISKIHQGDRDDIVILFIPSHDKSRPQKKVADQDIWASRAMELFGTLYGGATGFTALKGIWEDDDGTLLLDQPIMVQSLATRKNVESEANLRRLLEFVKRMGKQTNQASVGLIFNDVMHFIRDYR